MCGTFFTKERHYPHIWQSDFSTSQDNGVTDELKEFSGDPLFT